MGLDMYLYAKRSFDPRSPQADQILANAGVTLEELRAISALDPYEHQTYVYLPRWDHYPQEDRDRSIAVLEAAGLAELATDESGGGELRYTDGKVLVGVCCVYWRKANAIHAWFVDEVQGGVDECQEAIVHPEKLLQLRELAAKSAKGEPALQPRGGFFFGSTDVDEWYVQDMERTVVELDRVIQTAARNGGCEFVYQSSW